MDQMAAIKRTFFQECEEQLCELETGLLAIDDGDTDSETVNAVFRAVHSIKGGAGAFSLEELVQFAHVFESALDHLRAGHLAPSGEVLKTMLRAADMLADLVRAARGDGSVDVASREELANELRALDPHAPSKESGDGIQESEDDDPEIAGFEPVAICFDDRGTELHSIQNRFLIHFAPKPGLYAKANETALLMRELSELGETQIICDYSRLPPLDELDPEHSYLSWTVELSTLHDEIAVRNVFEFVEWDCDLEIQELDPEPDPMMRRLPRSFERCRPQSKPTLRLEVIRRSLPFPPRP